MENAELLGHSKDFEKKKRKYQNFNDDILLSFYLLFVQVLRANIDNNSRGSPKVQVEEKNVRHLSSYIQLFKMS